MKKVVVGLSTNIKTQKEDVVPGVVMDYLYDFYIDACRKNNAIPIMLPVVDDLEDVSAMLDRVDCLVLTGGYNVNPYLYGEEPHPKLGAINIRRDKFEMALIEEALKRDMPILGICRGMQLLNVYHGGSLHQDFSLREEDTLSHHIDGAIMDAPLRVELNKDSILYSIFKKDQIDTNTYHHQLINKLGDDLKSTATSADGVIKALEHKTKDNIIAIQWHPEVLFPYNKDMNNLFVKIFEMARNYRDNQ